LMASWTHRLKRQVGNCEQALSDRGDRTGHGNLTLK
jgi:hypothetical protein